MIINKEDKLRYLQRIVSSKGKCDYEGPTTLFKYRPFDAYTFSMLENNSLFLSGAYKQDDETECMTKIDTYELFDYYANNLKPLCVETIISLVKPYCRSDNYERVRFLIHKAVLRNGKVRNDVLLDIIPEIKELLPGFDSAHLFNFLANIPEKLDKEEIKEQVEGLIALAIDAQHKTGICSLTANSNDDDLWRRYSSNQTGYCIEYDLSDYKYKSMVLPVVYDDNRNERIITAIMGNFIGELVTAISHEEIKADNTHFLRLFLSKYTKWEQQNEWRIIGDPDVEFPAPRIKRIILGTNVSKENEEKMRDYCNKNRIDVFKIKGDLC